jgi:TRAP transporter TAXI family solute receptor
MSIGTAGTGGIYYPLGGALANRLSLRDSARQYTAEVTGGSVENANRLREGQIDLGFVLAVTLVDAYNGTGDYETPAPQLRVVAPLSPNLHHILLPENSTLSSVADFRGLRVSVGSPGSGTEQLSRQLLEAYDISYEDIQVRYLSFNESAAALTDGSIDGAVFSVGYPAGAVMEATTTGGARLLGVDPGTREALLERYPFYGSYDIPAGTYAGQDEVVPTVGLLTWVVAPESLPDEVVTAVLDIMYEDAAALEQVHPIAAQIDLAALRNAPIPLHPAVEGWLDAHGF